MNGLFSLNPLARLAWALTLVLLLWCPVSSCSPSHEPDTASPAPPGDLGPTAMIASPDAGVLYIACGVARRVLVLDTTNGQVMRTLAAPPAPSGLALSKDGTRLFVTCAAPSSRVCIFNTADGKLLKTMPAGHTALSPVLSRDEKALFVCERFNDAVSVLDLAQGREVARIQVTREPMSAALSPDGAFLLVANHLPAGRSDVGHVAASVSVIDVARRLVTKELRLPNGTINLRDIRVSPDGRYACVAHSVGRFQLPVTQLQRGWINASALTVMDLASLQIVNTVLLDDVERGAANPWALAWSAGGRWLAVTHAGTHELSLIDFPALLEKLTVMRGRPEVADGVPNDPTFLTGLRRRVQLNGNGPRAVAVLGERIFVAGHFSDTLEVVRFSANASLEQIALNAGHKSTPVRRGEMHFNDATLCFQGWQSCASCHDDDGRVDGLNWDLLNDGIGNPKDTKSLLLSYQTPPVMSLGVRATAEVAVRSGIQNSLASALPEEVASAIDQWLKGLKPAPSPKLVNGALSAAARRGEQIFNSAATGCGTCHGSGLFTDLHSYNVGTANPFDKEAVEFDTPTLCELWRTAPYLHDGSAPAVRDVLTTRNLKDEHGRTSQLSSQQLDDLVEYLLSL